MDRATRRTFIRNTLLASSAGALPALWSRPALAQEKTRLRVSVIPIVDVVPIYAAIQQGYFREEGLEVDPSPVAGGAAGIPGLVAGAYDIVFTNTVSSVLARQQNLKIKIMAPGWSARREAPDSIAIIARKGEGISRGADLVGKSVAVNTRNNITWLFVSEWIERTGGDPKKVTFREVPFPQTVDALKGKQVDAALIVEPFYTVARDDPALDVIAFPYHEVKPGMEIASYVTTEDFIAKNPQTVRKFTSAMKKAVDWVNANRQTPGFAELVSSYTRLPPDRVSRMIIADGRTAIDEQAIDITMQLMRKHGLLNQPLTVEALLARPGS